MAVGLNESGGCWEMEVREDRGVFGGSGLVDLGEVIEKIINNEKLLFMSK